MAAWLCVFLTLHLVDAGTLGFAALSKHAAIPDYRLNTLTEASLPAANTSANTTQAAAVAESTFGSTLAQDAQRCRILKLPDDLWLWASGKSSWSLAGEWSTGNGVRLAGWNEALFSSDYQTIRIGSDLGSKLSLSASIKTDEEMKYLYDWVPNPAAEAGLNTALLDCEQQLMFVIRQRESLLREPDIYSRDGTLVARSMVDWAVERVQFVDLQGYLLATAESPAYMANVSRKLLQGDPAKGNVLPYSMHFEQGGYSGSSRLLEPEYHWVLATATQVRAVTTAARPEGLFDPVKPPSLSMALSYVTSVLVVTGILVLAFVMCSIFKVVYPEDYLAGGDNPFLLAPRQLQEKRRVLSGNLHRLA